MARLLLLILLMLSPVMAYSAHITDKLLAGMYSTSDNSQQPVQLLPSGTPVELINEKNGFVQVQLVDGKTGWVEKRFLSEEKPANVRLLALQSKYRQLQNKLDLALAGEDKQTVGAESLKVDDDLVALQESERLLKEALVNAERQAEQLKKQLEERAEPMAQEPDVEAKEGDSSRYLPWLIALGLFFVGVGLGVYKGMQVQDERQRRRHGGFRI